MRHSALALLACAISMLGARASLVTQSGPRYFPAASEVSCDFYIGPSGSDSNSGLSTGAAWAITAINTKRATYAGNTVCLMDGTYDLLDAFGTAHWDTYLGGDNFNGNILSVGATGDGTAGNPTIITAVTRWGAILDMGYNQISCPASNRNTGTLGPDGDWIEFRNFKIVNAGYAAMNINNSDDILVDGVWVDSQLHNPCTVTNSNSASFLNYNTAERVTIRNSRTSNCGAPGDGDRHGSIIGFNMRSWVIENNEFLTDDTTQADAIHVKNNLNHSITYRYNYQTGKIKWEGNQAGQTSYINNNVIIANRPIWIQGAPETINIVNNTLVARDSGYSSGSNGGLIGRDISGLVNSYNNIAVPFNNSAWHWKAYNYSSTSGDRGTIDYNSVAFNGSNKFNASVGSGSPSYTTLAAWTAATSHDSHGFEGTSYSFAGGTPDNPAEAYELGGGSIAIGMCKSDGTTGGTDVDCGAWGNFGTTSYGTAATHVGVAR
jgi:hypothetical protein